MSQKVSAFYKRSLRQIYRDNMVVRDTKCKTNQCSQFPNIYVRKALISSFNKIKAFGETWLPSCGQGNNVHVNCLPTKQCLFSMSPYQTRLIEIISSLVEIPRPEMGVSDKEKLQNVQFWGARNMIGNHRA